MKGVKKIRPGKYAAHLAEPAIYILHENSEWVEPLRREMEQMELPYEEWFIDDGTIDLAEIPANGVYYNRMSASSHTRDHRFAAELTAPVLGWLEAHGRRVINNRNALQYELRKMEQYIQLNTHGIKTPRTIAATGKENILAAAWEFLPGSFIVKPNRGGKGTAVQLIHSLEALETALQNGSLESLDGLILLQEYIKPQDGTITRVEFIDGKFFYAVKVDASDGFELCPADACEIDDAFCPVGEQTPENNKFKIQQDYFNEEIAKYERFLNSSGMEIAAIEYVKNEKGERYVYDVNINTNYNSAAEEQSAQKKRGMKGIAEFLGRELAKLQAADSEAAA